MSPHFRSFAHKNIKMLRLVHCITVALFWTILTCHVQGQRRFLADDNADLSSLVAKLTLEVKKRNPLNCLQL